MNHVHDVIVVGGGPSGIAAAIELRRNGVSDVLLLERETTLGGATRHCSHSPFGMLEFGRIYFGASYGERLTKEAALAGVAIHTSHSVVEMNTDGTLLVCHPCGISTLHAKRILVATGARERPRYDRLVSGDRPVGVVSTGALQAYIAFHGMLPFKRPLIVGSELVSFSALLTCVSHGAKPVGMLESNSRITARKPLQLMPSVLGIPLWTDATLVDIRGQKRVQSAVVKRGEFLVEVDCDGILFTGEFVPESSLLARSLLALPSGDAAPLINQYGQLEEPQYFAAGNVLRAIETGGWAYREGRSVGRSIALNFTSKATATAATKVRFTEPVKLVVPGMISADRATTHKAFELFQVRMRSSEHGCLKLVVDGNVTWKKTAHWLPERRILIPMPAHIQRATDIALVFERSH